MINMTSQNRKYDGNRGKWVNDLIMKKIDVENIKPH